MGFLAYSLDAFSTMESPNASASGDSLCNLNGITKVLQLIAQ